MASFWPRRMLRDTMAERCRSLRCQHSSQPYSAHLLVQRLIFHPLQENNNNLVLVYIANKLKNNTHLKIIYIFKEICEC